MIKRVLLSRLSWIPLVLILGWQAYKTVVPKPYQLDNVRKILANQIIEDAVNKVPSFEHIEKIAILKFKGDYTNFVTHKFKEELFKTGKYNIVKDSILKRILKEFGKEEVPIYSYEEALKIGKKIGTEGVIFGEILEFLQDEKEAKMEMFIRLLDLNNEKAVFIDSFSGRLPKNVTSFNYMKARIKDTALGMRIVFWILFVGFLPLATFFIIKKVLEKESNLSNLILMCCYVFVNFLFAFILTGFSIDTFWAFLFILISFGLSIFYNYFIFNFFEKYWM